MTDYRQLMLLLIEKRSYREIATRLGCSQRTIAKVRRVLDEQQLVGSEQVAALALEEIDGLFSDGRKSAADGFVPVDIDKVVQSRLGRKKPPLKVLWAKYLQTDAPAGVRHYGYERFCQIIAEYVRVRDLTAPIKHVPGHTMQVDWAGTRMQIIDPISRATTPVSVFVASLPYSGLVFAYGYLDEKQPAWHDAHRRAFEYVNGVTLLVVPDNASTASNQISKASRARDVNGSYAEFLEHYRTAAVPTRSAAPRDKGNVEAGVKVVTNWVIHYLNDQVFASLDDLNGAVAERVEWINRRIPFRGEQRSRMDWFEEAERTGLLELPAQRWEPVVWRKAKVHRDWHVQIDTIKYSVPYEFAGLNVDVRIVGEQLDVLADGAVIATHQRGSHRNGYVTDAEHAPAYLEETAGLWTRAYFLRQAAKVGPGTVAALTRLLDGKKIEAQGFRSCMNILDLGKRGSRQQLERACKQLTDNDAHRQISYTAVKHALAVVRAEQDERPQIIRSGARTTGTESPHSRRIAGRDTSGAHLAGPGAFSLEALTGIQPGAEGADV
ncbi:IS21 family transposase [Leucobacter salsicius]|uniref:IS21 family transposase n=1 Tax=Leucobacter salsicius TaxID=664638 RepID=UPI00034DEFC0|nr:IS21 family transposase [Leucobacter salsicius]